VPVAADHGLMLPQCERVKVGSVRTSPCSSALV
jgi:hypothetical protein